MFFVFLDFKYTSCLFGSEGLDTVFKADFVQHFNFGNSPMSDSLITCTVPHFFEILSNTTIPNVLTSLVKFFWWLRACIAWLTAEKLIVCCGYRLTHKSDMFGVRRGSIFAVTKSNQKIIGINSFHDC